MKKSFRICLLFLSVALLLSACGTDEGVTPVYEDSSSPSATIATDATPSASPLDESEAPLPTMDFLGLAGLDATVEVLKGGFKKLYEQCDAVLVGQLTQSLGEYNAARDPKDESKPSTEDFFMEMQFKFKIEEVIKGKDLKKDGEITYSLAYKQKTRYDDEYTMLEYREPPLNKLMLLFVMKDRDFDDIYYVQYEPSCFLFDETAQLFKLFSFNETLAKTWEEGKVEQGATLATIKNDMGVK